LERIQTIALLFCNPCPQTGEGGRKRRKKGEGKSPPQGGDSTIFCLLRGAIKKKGGRKKGKEGSASQFNPSHPPARKRKEKGGEKGENGFRGRAVYLVALCL